MFYIYRITNLVNGKTYIGQHKYKKLNDNYMGSGTYLARAKKKYGIENFKKEILYSNIQYKETADDMERFAIAKERALGKAEYNIANGGQGGAGHKMSEEAKRKLSDRNKGNQYHKGHHHSEKTKKMWSEKRKGRPGTMKGKHLTEEQKKKCSESHKGKPGYWQGKQLSEEHKEKLSKSKQEVREAFKKSGRKDWNAFQKEYKEKHK